MPPFLPGARGRLDRGMPKRRQGRARLTIMLDQIGWWTFVTETHTLINRVSDQRIRFESAVDEAGSLLRPPASGPARFRFSYEDAEVCYPVLVTARYDAMAVRASITAIVTGDRSVGRSTIPPQRWSGVAHVAPAQKSLLTDCGGASMTPCSMPWPAGRQAKRPDQSLRVSTPGAAGRTACGRRGCGVSARDGRKGIRRSKAGFGRSSSRWGARHCRGSSWMRRK